VPDETHTDTQRLNFLEWILGPLPGVPSVSRSAMIEDDCSDDRADLFLIIEAQTRARYFECRSREGAASAKMWMESWARECKRVLDKTVRELMRSESNA
jgi:hypothetical protein